MFAHVEHGLLPVSGGVLDQVDSFMEAVNFVRIEESRVKAKLRAPVDTQ